MGTLRPARSQRVPALLQKLRLAYSGVRVEGTPRRLAVMVEGLATQQTTQESEVGRLAFCLLWVLSRSKYPKTHGHAADAQDEAWVGRLALLWVCVLEAGWKAQESKDAWPCSRPRCLTLLEAASTV